MSGLYYYTLIIIIIITGIVHKIIHIVVNDALLFFRRHGTRDH